MKRRDRSGRSSVTVKKKRSADTEQLMLCGCTPLAAWWTWKRRISSDVAVSGARLRNSAKLRTKPDIIALRVLPQAARRHVFEHPSAQRTHGL
jgi:hypothetical protein